MADDKEPQKIIKRTLPSETHAERKIAAVFTEADISEAKQLVASMNKPGAYLERGKLKKIAASSVKKLFGAGSDN